jgi:hypothetical protein
VATEDAFLDFLRRTGWRVSVAAEGPNATGSAEHTETSGEIALIEASGGTRSEVVTKLFEQACEVLYGRRPVFEDPPLVAAEPRH